MTSLQGTQTTDPRIQAACLFSLPHQLLSESGKHSCPGFSRLSYYAAPPTSLSFPPSSSSPIPISSSPPSPLLNRYCIPLPQHRHLSVLVSDSSILLFTMRIATSTVLLGAASAVSAGSFQQKVLGGNFQESIMPLADSIGNTRESFESALKDMPTQAKALWDEIKLLVPEGSFDQSTWFSKPKPHRKRHDWDHVVKGADLQKLWVQDADGESHRQVEGRLEDFNLRVKSVDPSKLGVDKVKQYSGYLDDEANDKHLFYCKL